MPAQPPSSFDQIVTRAHRSAPLLERAWDGLLVAVCAGLALLDLLVLLASGRSQTWLYTGVVGAATGAVAVGALSVAAVAAVALRRRMTLGCLVALASASLAVTACALVLSVSLPPSFAVLFALAVLVTRAVHTEPELPAAGATALALLAVLGEAARVQDAGVVSFGQVLCTIGLGGAVVVGLWLRFNDWRRSSTEQAVRSDERLELARELHDLVGHYVTGMVVQAQAGQMVAEADPASAVESFARIEAAGADALSAVRRMVGNLRDEPIRAPGVGWVEIEALVASAVDDGVPVRCWIDDSVRSVPLELTSSVHRLVAESLTNVRRHAVAVTRVDVSVRVQGAVLVVDVYDDGQANTHRGSGTYGLVGMGERAEALGGTLYAGPAPSGGWLVSARLPLASGSAGPAGPGGPAGPAGPAGSAGPAGGAGPARPARTVGFGGR